MSGEVSDEDVEELQHHIKESEAKIQRIVEEIKELNELVGELKVSDIAQMDAGGNQTGHMILISEMSYEVSQAQTNAERERKEAEKERKTGHY